MVFVMHMPKHCWPSVVPVPNKPSKIDCAAARTHSNAVRPHRKSVGERPNAADWIIGKQPTRSPGCAKPLERHKQRQFCRILPHQMRRDFFCRFAVWLAAVVTVRRVCDHVRRAQVHSQHVVTCRNITFMHDITSGPQRVGHVATPGATFPNVTVKMLDSAQRARCWRRGRVKVTRGACRSVSDCHNSTPHG